MASCFPAAVTSRAPLSAPVCPILRSDARRWDNDDDAWFLLDWLVRVSTYASGRQCRTRKGSYPPLLPKQVPSKKRGGSKQATRRRSDKQAGGAASKQAEMRVGSLSAAYTLAGVRMGPRSRVRCHRTDTFSVPPGMRHARNRGRAPRTQLHKQRRTPPTHRPLQC